MTEATIQTGDLVTFHIGGLQFTGTALYDMQATTVHVMLNPPEPGFLPVQHIQFKDVVRVQRNYEFPQIIKAVPNIAKGQLWRQRVVENGWTLIVENPQGDLMLVYTVSHQIVARDKLDELLPRYYELVAESIPAAVQAGKVTLEELFGRSK
jgi:hypothetical protein